jgi:hypothetical protein
MERCAILVVEPVTGVQGKKLDLGALREIGRLIHRNLQRFDPAPRSRAAQNLPQSGPVDPGAAASYGESLESHSEGAS